MRTRSLKTSSSCFKETKIIKTNTRVVDKDKEVRQDHELHGRGNDVIPSVVLNLSPLLYVASVQGKTFKLLMD